MFKSCAPAFKNYLCIIFVALLFVLSVLPGFELIGNLFAQVISTIALNVFLLVVVDIVFKIRPEFVSLSLIAMSVFWVICAIIGQIKLHINSGNYSFKWLHLFYYDKPALIFLTMFITILFYIIRLLTKKNDIKYIDSYKKFISNTVKCLLAYYAIILFYCFYLVREITFERPEPNLIPFEVIRFSVSVTDYELLFLLLGNIAIFFPLGVFVSSLNKNKALNILLPVIISSAVELSQYLLGNGHPDIDDVILNVIGYYLGIGARIILDRMVYKASDKKFQSFIIF